MCQWPGTGGLLAAFLGLDRHFLGCYFLNWVYLVFYEPGSFICKDCFYFLLSLLIKMGALEFLLVLFVSNPWFKMFVDGGTTVLTNPTTTKN